ncbi:MAG: rRNA maturation RNase YbeY [Desulfococcaceae bacterium]|jgi:probable rRNA maturation factor|nr:rRNA maturation RNase YbeY [Desulfococcaceae bacterium]
MQPEPVQAEAIKTEKIKQTALKVLKALGNPDAELSLLICSDREMAGYNENYLGRPGPTNVIAFPMQEGECSDINPHLLGDVVISADTARREAAETGISFARRFDELLVHGILHLFAYDHEKSDAEELRMEKKSEELLKLIYSE